ncbi:MAG TPA: hypothetical protein VF597_02240 [Candidatus Saccharimonadales bacterium]|jgi:hypothetical protein
MNKDLLPKKLGEVEAFARVGLEMLARAGDTAETAFGERLVTEIKMSLQSHVDTVSLRSDSAKADRTTAKVRDMMEQYIGDEWDNPIELLEWSGFYLGAAGIHWSLVASLSDDEADAAMMKYAAAQANLFYQWLEQAFVRIQQQKC